MPLDVLLDPTPIALVIPDPFARCTNREELLQGRNISPGKFQFRNEFRLFFLGLFPSTLLNNEFTVPSSCIDGKSKGEKDSDSEQLVRLPCVVPVEEGDDPVEDVKCRRDGKHDNRQRPNDDQVFERCRFMGERLPDRGFQLFLSSLVGNDRLTGQFRNNQTRDFTPDLLPGARVKDLAGP